MREAPYGLHSTTNLRTRRRSGEHWDTTGDKMCCTCGADEAFPLPPRRERRTSMKKMTLRKMSSQDRINMNRFWNEMEDFYTRQEEEGREDPWGSTCDREVEKVMGRLDSQEEQEGEATSCYSSLHSSCYSSLRSSCSSPLDSPPGPCSPLPLPPSLLHTRLLLDLVERLEGSRKATAV